MRRRGALSAAEDPSRKPVLIERFLLLLLDEEEPFFLLPLSKEPFCIYTVTRTNYHFTGMPAISCSSWGKRDKGLSSSTHKKHGTVREEEEEKENIFPDSCSERESFQVVGMLSMNNNSAPTVRRRLYRRQSEPIILSVIHHEELAAAGKLDSIN